MSNYRMSQSLIRESYGDLPSGTFGPHDDAPAVYYVAKAYLRAQAGNWAWDLYMPSKGIFSPDEGDDYARALQGGHNTLVAWLVSRGALEAA